jgi:hypothetical protein
MSQDIIAALKEVLDDKGDKNYDPRMEELSRSDKLIDPTNEALSKLEEQEIFHISKIRGAQISYSTRVRILKKLYSTPDMKDYHTQYIDYIRALSEDNPYDKAELDSYIGGLPMTNLMISELIKLRHAEDAWTAKLYADSIKPQVANVPTFMPSQQEPQEGFFSKALNFIFGKKDNGAQGYNRK